MKTCIQNGRLIDPQSKMDQVNDLFLADGKIVAIGVRPDGFADCQRIDATGLIVCPGLIDLAARLREPGLEYMATLESEQEAAVAGGVTSLACPPDTDPPLDEPGLVEMLKHRARNLDRAQVYPVGALTQGLEGERLTEMAELRDAGCIAFSQADAPIANLHVLMRAMQYAATFGFKVWLRPQDHHLANHGVAHEGEVATRLGLPIISVSAETIALANILALMKETGASVHFCRISSAAGVAMLRAAKQQGLSLTCDVAIHHVHLIDMDIGFFDTNCRLIPPLRSFEDREALRAGLLDGTIDAICSDHAPIDDDAKLVPFAQAEPGATGLELLLPLTLKWAREARLPLIEALGRITNRPARILGIEDGRLIPDGRADLCVFDPEQDRVITAQTLKSLGKNTPFIGTELCGQVKFTFIAGHLVYRG
ncbi:dihydroorotase [Nitrosomonas mobilis]|uniref:Dihydroorotase-like protein n=1 Tax=Nitrosomonas mobilis TaxID=51642 RepID=A0A1G5SDA8_9PROT|nr:dihydroorotase [Nitrosomonas mobilis]SCZ84399.1 Dihydroorotase-like protein [Nitrosomonas mobilis]HNO75891.1 dihydroorotase [Nitrosomonas mobilis]